MAHDPELERVLKLSQEESRKTRICDEEVPFGFTRHPIPDDGNCLFHAIGYAVGKPHLVVRNEICQWLTTHIYQYAYRKILATLLAEQGMILDFKVTPHELVTEDPSVRQVVSRYIHTIQTCVGKPEGYGGQIEIMAATIVYQRTIVYFFSSTHGMDYKFSIYQKIDRHAIVLFNCKLNKLSRYRNHWEVLIIEPEYQLADLLELFTFSSAFRKEARKSAARKHASRKSPALKSAPRKSPTRKNAMRK